MGKEEHVQVEVIKGIENVMEVLDSLDKLEYDQREYEEALIKKIKIEKPKTNLGKNIAEQVLETFLQVKM